MLEGGLDGIETLGNSHLIGTTPIASIDEQKGQDRYGGSLENRCRFAKGFEEIRRQAGDEFHQDFRSRILEAMKDGLSQEECIEAAHIFERSGYIDFFNGNYGRRRRDGHLVHRALWRQHAINGNRPIANLAYQCYVAFKREVSLPVEGFHAARITDIDYPRDAIQEGLLDMVGP